MPTNEERSEREISQFMSQPPAQVFAYYNQDPRVGGQIQNWMGAKLGTITWVGKVSRPMGGKVVSIRMKAINGLTYAGKCNLSSGNYCKLRQVKPKLYTERDSSNSRRDPQNPYNRSSLTGYNVYDKNGKLRWVQVQTANEAFELMRNLGGGSISERYSDRGAIREVLFGAWETREGNPPKLPSWVIT